MEKKKLLFVCLGNICRSPTAEAVAIAKLEQRGLLAHCDSAGTSGYHDGETSDPRSIRHAEKRGYKMISISRRVVDQDFKHFDFILAMDSSNLENLRRMCPDPQWHGKLVLITDYCRRHKVAGVPDPYYGSAKDFDLVIDILEDAVDGFLDRHFG